MCKTQITFPLGDGSQATRNVSCFVFPTFSFWGFLAASTYSLDYTYYVGLYVLTFCDAVQIIHMPGLKHS